MVFWASYVYIVSCHGRTAPGHLEASAMLLLHIELEDVDALLTTVETTHSTTLVVVEIPHMGITLEDLKHLKKLVLEDV